MTEKKSNNKINKLCNAEIRAEIALVMKSSQWYHSFSSVTVIE